MIILNPEEVPVESKDSPLPTIPVSTPSTYQYPLTVPLAALDGVPPVFMVGSDYTPPLISCHSVLAHILLLCAFHALEHSISTPPAEPSDPFEPVRWRVFVHQATWRFSIWIHCVVKPRELTSGKLKDEEIPPLDVLLVWHAYLLNPCAYADDTARLHQELKALGGLPLERIAAQIDPVTFKFELTPAQSTFWRLTTLTPPEPLSLSPSSGDELGILCPRCSGPPLRVPWLREPQLKSNGYAQGGGWCQNQFSVWCRACRLTVTRESIAVGRFSADIAIAMADKRSVLPGLLFDPITCVPSAPQAQLITTFLLQPFVDLPPTNLAIGDHLGWSYVGMERSVVEARGILADAVRARESPAARRILGSPGLPKRAGRGELRARIVVAQGEVGSDVSGTWRSFGPRITKMLAAYRDNPASFSVDLVGAVLRQTTFTSKMFSLGWLDPFNVTLPLVQSITRYHSFLHLLARFPNQFLVPALDVDLGWHTHQLRADVYMSDTRRCVGRFIDHDDKVDERVLMRGFETTSRLWEATFQVPYSSCESLTPARSTTFSRIVQLARGVSSAPETPENESSWQPDPTTSPSEHPCISVIGEDRHIHERSKRERTLGAHYKRKLLRTADELSAKPVDIPTSPGDTVAFGDLGLQGWALLGNLDQNIMDVNAVEKGQCCAGYGIPHYAGPMWGDDGAGVLDR